MIKFKHVGPAIILKKNKMSKKSSNKYYHYQRTAYSNNKHKAQIYRPYLLIQIHFLEKWYGKKIVKTQNSFGTRHRKYINISINLLNTYDFDRLGDSAWSQTANHLSHKVIAVRLIVDEIHLVQMSETISEKQLHKDVICFLNTFIICSFTRATRTSTREGRTKTFFNFNFNSF